MITKRQPIKPCSKCGANTREYCSSWCKECKREYQSKYRKTRSGKASRAKSQRKWRANNKQKTAAYNAVNAAIRDGVLPHVSTRKCQKCGEQAEHYHHWSYKKEHRLSVVPMCHRCHAKT